MKKLLFALLAILLLVALVGCPPSEPNQDAFGSGPDRDMTEEPEEPAEEPAEEPMEEPMEEGTDEEGDGEEVEEEEAAEEVEEEEEGGADSAALNPG